MQHYLLALLTLLITQISFGLEPNVRLVGSVYIHGDSKDRSGLSSQIHQEIPHNRFGGISAIEHVEGNEYLLLADRGPLDGACEFECRVHRATIELIPNTKDLSFNIQETILLRNQNHPILGSIAPSNGAMRLDPESIRVDRTSGRWWISDEYGPSIVQFDTVGNLTSILKIPPWYQVSELRVDPQKELNENQIGRQPNGGFESLTLTPSGSLVAMLQKPLIQDLHCNNSTSPLRSVLRILKINPTTDARQEYLYPLDDAGFVTSEILAVDENRFLVIERDSKPARESKLKRVYICDIAQATDICSHQASLHDLVSQTKIEFARKELLIDLLSPHSGIALDTVGAKVEGLCFGPDLANSDKLLLVAVDNDFIANQATWIYAYSISSN